MLGQTKAYVDDDDDQRFLIIKRLQTDCQQLFFKTKIILSTQAEE